MRIACLNRKGGCGKTTLAVNLAAALHLLGRRVNLIDLDPQASATYWAQSAQVNPSQTFALHEACIPFALPEKKPSQALLKLLQQQRKRNPGAIQVFDTTPKTTDETLLAALVADLILIPATPSPLDIWATESAVDLLHRVRDQRHKQPPRAALVPWRLMHSTRMSKRIVQALEQYGEPVISPISQRSVLAEMALEGRTVADLPAKNDVRLEFEQLARDVLGLLPEVGVG